MGKLKTDLLHELSDDHVVIDLDTGTVLGTNLVVLNIKDAIRAERAEGNEIDEHRINVDDSLACEIGTKHGRPLLVEED